MKKVKSTQMENRSIVKMVKYGVTLNVYQKNCDDEEDKHLLLVETKEFIDINEANSYIRDQASCVKSYEVVLNKNLTVEQEQRNVFNYSDLEAEVSIYLNGYHLSVKTDFILCAAKIDGSKWKEHKEEKVLASISKIKLDKGKTFSILSQEVAGDSDKLEVSFLNIETENNKFVIGKKESLKHIVFRKVTFDKALKSLEINGSFYYVDTGKKENKKVEVSESLLVTNTNCEASVLVPMKVRDLMLDGKITVFNFKSSGKVSTNPVSRFCVLPNGNAELNNIKVTYRGQQTEEFCFAMEQKVALIKYENYSKEEWDNLFEESKDNSEILKDVFEKVKLLSERGKLTINGNIKFSGKESACLRMEKYFCWKAYEEDVEVHNVYFKYLVEFNKKTFIEDGESIVTIPKTTANDFSIAYDGICLSKYGKHLKAVVTTVAVICENTGQRLEYETFEDAVENLKTDFYPKKAKGKVRLKFQFIFLKDQVLTKNISFPFFVETVSFMSPKALKENGWLIKYLELNEYTLSLYGMLKLHSGLRIISSGKVGTLKLMGKRKEAGLDVFVGGKFYITPQELYCPEVFYPLKNVNVLSANGCITLDGKCNAGVKGNFTVFECVISNQSWQIDSITATNLFVSGTEREVYEKEKDNCSEEAILLCDKIQVSGKVVVESNALKEKINCNILDAKILELHEGMVKAVKSANIVDVLLFGNSPNIRVEGSIFQIKGKVVCGASQARFTTALNQKNEAALYIGGQVELLNNEQYSISGKKLIVNVISQDNTLDLRSEEHNRNILLKVKSAKETDFLAEDCNGKVFDIFDNDNDSYVLKKNKNVIEVLGGEKVSVALFADEKELKIINSYATINEAFKAIDDLKNKEVDYIIRVRGNIGKEGKKERIDLKFPRYARKVTLISDENVTIWCKSTLSQKTHIRLENVSLNSSSGYSVGNGNLELINTKLEVHKLNAKKVKMSGSEIKTQDISVVKEIVLLEGEDKVNRSTVTAFRKMLVKNMTGIGDLITCGNVVLANSLDADFEDYSE